MSDIDELIDDILWVEDDTDTGPEEDVSEDTETNEFGAIPIQRDDKGIKATILSVFDNVDISPLTVDIMMDDDSPTNATVVLWEIDNQTDKSIHYGNDAITYVLEDRLKINPTGSEVVWQPEKIGSVWNRAPSPGHYTDIESGIKTRWASLVDNPNSSKLSLVILDSKSHNPIAFELSAENFADESNLPY